MRGALACDSCEGMSNMGGIGKGEKSDPAGKHEKQAKKPPRSPIEQDDVEDGDFATPKRDRYGDDDQPL
jgi:hypothetical protein